MPFCGIAIFLVSSIFSHPLNFNDDLHFVVEVEARAEEMHSILIRSMPSALVRDLSSRAAHILFRLPFRSPPARLPPHQRRG